MKQKIFIVLVLTVFLFSCGEKRKEKGNDEKAIEKISLRQEWFANSNYSGAVFASKKFAKPNNIEIDVVPGADNIDPIKMVISGQNDFGDAGADRVLEAIDKGADLVIIGVVNLNSPTCFISKTERNIKTPMDFKNKKVGILTGTSTEYVYQVLIKKMNINRTDIKEIEAPFDLGTFLLDQYDVRPAFIYDEPVSLDLKEISYNIIEPKDYGITFLGTVYFTTKKMIEEKPEVVQAFINSVADGWKASLSYPETAIKYLKEYDKTIDEERELNSLMKGKDYFSGKDGKILWADISDWQGMMNILKQLNKVSGIKLEEHIDNSFLKNYYKQVETKNNNFK